jgi:hypothetical protein
MDEYIIYVVSHISRMRLGKLENELISELCKKK